MTWLSPLCVFWKANGILPSVCGDRATSVVVLATFVRFRSRFGLNTLWSWSCLGFGCNSLKDGAVSWFLRLLRQMQSIRYTYYKKKKYYNEKNKAKKILQWNVFEWPLSHSPIWFFFFCSTIYTSGNSSIFQSLSWPLTEYKDGQSHPSVCEHPLGSSTIGLTVGTILSFQFALKPENSRFECVGGTEGERWLDHECSILYAPMPTHPVVSWLQLDAIHKP